MYDMEATFLCLLLACCEIYADSLFGSFSLVSKKDHTFEATKLHFENLVKRYGNPIIILNLIKVGIFTFLMNRQA